MGGIPAAKFEQDLPLSLTVHTLGEPKVTRRTSAVGYVSDAHTAAMEATPAPRLWPYTSTRTGVLLADSRPSW